MGRAAEESNRRMLRVRDAQRRRVERAMALLRDTDRSVTDICIAVGFTSLGTFSRTFAGIVGEPPSAYRGAGRCRTCRRASRCGGRARPPQTALSEKRRSRSARTRTSASCAG